MCRGPAFGWEFCISFMNFGKINCIYQGSFFTQRFPNYVCNIIVLLRAWKRTRSTQWRSARCWTGRRSARSAKRSRSSMRSCLLTRWPLRWPRRPKAPHPCQGIPQKRPKKGRATKQLRTPKILLMTCPQRTLCLYRLIKMGIALQSLALKHSKHATVIVECETTPFFKIPKESAIISWWNLKSIPNFFSKL